LGITQSKVPRAGIKIKDKWKGPTETPCKNIKAHKVPLFYNLSYGDMDIIEYQVWVIVEEDIWEEKKKQVEQYHKV
jgi:hypothetical protein